MWQYYMEMIAFAIVLLVIAGEYIWLYRLSRKQEKQKKLFKETSEEIDSRLTRIFGAAGHTEQEQEIAGLQEYTKDFSLGMDILCEKLSHLARQAKAAGVRKAAMVRIFQVIDPVDYYSRQLKESDPYRQAYIIRKLSDYSDAESVGSIREFIRSPKKVLSYNAVMALAALGDEDSVVQFILNSEKEHLYSHRILLQILDSYTGDIASLTSVLLGSGNEYVRTAVIKGIAKHRIRRFESIYLLGLNSKNVDMKVACIRALGEIADPSYEHAMIVESHDKNWVVRAAAADALSRFPTENSMRALAQALSDPAWWVRHNAAHSLVAVDLTGKHVREALNQYDKYANEALKTALQQTASLSRKERVDL